MKKIIFDLLVSPADSPFLDRPEHTGLEPYIYLRDRLKEKGYEIRTPDNQKLEEVEWVLFWDYVDNTERHLIKKIIQKARSVYRRVQGKAAERNLYSECVNNGLHNRTALFIGEPAAVKPAVWDKKLHAKFPVVFTWNDQWVDNQHYFKTFWPITGYFPQVVNIPFSKRKLLVNFSANKFSSHPRELYSARRQTIRFFESQFPDQFDLFGPGWDHPGLGEQSYLPYPSWRGTVKNKWESYPYYRFGLCYENMFDEPGWVTEKIFDCMRSGCVPIYWGAGNIFDFVDRDTFIDRRNFTSDAELADYLFSVTENEFNQYRDAIDTYLESQKFSKFLPPAFAENIIHVLSL